MDHNCIKHSFEKSVAACSRCNHGFCARCLLYPFGEKKPGFCVACALAASGVRKNAGLTPAASAPKPSRQALRQQRKADKEASRLSALPPPPVVPGVIPSPFEDDTGIRFPTPH